MTRLFVAEKPSLAKAIAEGLGVVRKEKTCYRCQEDSVVTWCFGHLLEQAEPDAYLPDDLPKTKAGKKRWRMRDLPIFPEKWMEIPREDAGAKAQLNAIGALLKSADIVVNAADPDCEGQYLCDQVLEHFNNDRKTLRFWASAIDPVSIRRALESLKDNRKYAGMRDAARGRNRADWLLGMNLSRLYTLHQQSLGNQGLYAVGRVQTPTLTMVAQRDYAVRNFKPVPYLSILADLNKDNQTFTAKWQPSDTQPGMDTEGKLLINLEIGKALMEQLSKLTEAWVVSSETKSKKAYQPKCYSLADIQQEASKRFGFTAEHTLDVVQSLYERHKITSYPRTDCQYLPESQFADAPAILEAIARVMPQAANACGRADPTIKSPTWDDKKITAHHGIIPTSYSVNWNALTEDEQKLYACIAKRYIAQFYPVHEYAATKITLNIGEETFVATGNVPKVEGWKLLYRKQSGNSDDETEQDVSCNQTLPKLRKGQSVAVREIRCEEKKTKPPSYFTEGTLIAAMENIHRFYDNTEIKSTLKEADGIGTPATRAAIISELKRKKYLETEGKKLHCSAAGRNVLLNVSPRIRSAVLTAQFERMQKDVEAGKLSLSDFENRIKDFVLEELRIIRGY